MIKIGKLLPMIIIIGLSIIGWIFDLHHYLRFETLWFEQEAFEHFVSNHFLLSILIYMSIYISVVAMSIPAVTFMSIASGLLFGQWIGAAVVITSAIIGSSFIFLSAKMASSDFLSKRVGGLAKKMQKGFQENALSYLLTLRLIPIFPFFAVNLAAAFFQVPLRTFMLGTFFGIMPGTFIYVSMGVVLKEVIHKPDFSPAMVIDSKILIGLAGLGLLSLAPILYKYLKNDGHLKK